MARTPCRSRGVFDAFPPFVADGADHWLDRPDVTPGQWLEQGSPTSR